MLKFVFVMVALSSLASCGFEIVDTGYQGVHVSYGKVSDDVYPEGLHFYNPLTSDINEYSVKEEAVSLVMSSYSKDNQKIDIEATVVYSIDRKSVPKLYREYGSSREALFETIGSKTVAGVLKEVVGQYTADTMMFQRQKLSNDIEKAVSQSLATRHMVVSSVEVTDIDFTNEYEKSAEQKVIAKQNAEKAANETVRIEEEKKQAILRAQGEAEAIRIQANALKENKSLVELEAVRKWDGKLPVQMLGGAVPFINVK